MKVVLVLLLAAAVCAQSQLYEDSLEEEWQNFKADYGKWYDSQDEELLRRQIFLLNKQEIDRHNERFAAGGETFEMGVNQFTDLTPDEFQRTILGGYNATAAAELTYDLDFVDSALEDWATPATVDWRQRGAVTRVRNQGQCGSCWAFAAVATLEGRHFLKTGRLVELSEKNLLDCSSRPPYRNLGCNGGMPSEALRYVQNNRGIDTERSYPYAPHVDYCHFSRSNVAATVTRIMAVRPGDERALVAAVAKYGPISTAVEATHLHHYRGGVLSTPCHKRPDHAVTIVGYGTDSRSGPYWLVKNSWGERYGERGYVRIARNRNLCFIASMPVFPVA